MEIWKKVKNFEAYSISNKGNIRRNGHKRWNVNNNGYNYYKTRLLKPSTNNTKGYARIGLSINNKKSKQSIHRLVGIAFIPNPKNLPQINHIDGDKLNNIPENLEWCTNDYNMYHRNVYIDRHKGQKGEKCNFSKLTEEQVKQIPQLQQSYNLKQIAEILNIGHTTVCEIVRGRTWTHLNLYPKRLTAAVKRTQQKYVRLRDSPNLREI